MPLFQKSVLRKHLNEQDKKKVAEAYATFTAHFGSTAIQQNIRDAKEEEYQEGFVRDLFVQVLGYTLKPQPDYNFVLEKKNEKDSKKADGAVLKVNLCLAETAEWMSFFAEQKKKAMDLKNEIDKTDKEINRMVYALYELTEEEIKIVEGR